MNTINTPSRVDIDAILVWLQDPNISDIHLTSSWKSSYRLNGEIVKDDKIPLLSEDHMETIIKQLFQNNVQSMDKFMCDKESDFSYEGKNWISYRVNAFFERWRIGIVIRKISPNIKTLEEMMFSNLADSIKKHILTSKKWLFLVTWPTWSWKSTSIVSMLEHINKNRTENIMTIEDPIEYLFKSDKCIISQREVGHDTWSFKNALRAVMREDPDIVFVWEIRDTETAETVLSLAESWHLVFSTLHTWSAAHTLGRFLSFFPANMQAGIADRLADILLWIQSQMLVRRADVNARIGVYEFLLNTTAVKNNLKKMDFWQVDSIIEASTSVGMITMQQYAKKLLWKNLINLKDVEHLFKNSENQKSQMQGQQIPLQH